MKTDTALLVLWIAPAVIGGLLFFWLFPLKLLSRLAAQFGKSAPCPASLNWLVDNPIRRRYVRPVLDRVGIRPGERVLPPIDKPGTSVYNTISIANHLQKGGEPHRYRGRENTAL